jgi:S-DNA-T family DNA segregation ATPase FtsK/SpoIIIE
VLLAPVGTSLVLWLVTGSAVSLAFAGLGPLLMLVAVADGRWRLRRERRSDGRRYASRLAALETEIDDAHRRERSAEAARLPSAREWFADAAADRWATSPAAPLSATLGRADVRSALRLTPDRTGAEPPEVGRIRTRAGVLTDAPLEVDLRRGLCVTGPGAAADALLRAVLLQALCRVGPTTRVEVTGTPETWLAALPNPVGSHAAAAWPGGRSNRGGRSTAHRVVLSDGGIPAVLARAATPGDTPAECSAVVWVGVGGGRVDRHPALPPGAQFVPDAVSSVEAFQFARTLSAAAGSLAGGMPDRVALSALLRAAAAVPGSLRCPIGVGPDGIVELDLVSDGPHAVVGGTTGSGKSELLRSWVLALAALHPPTVVQFLLLDFKGGATFSDLGVLPHTAGVLTDLDPAAVRRAVASIRAELAHREGVLAAAGERSLDGARDAGLSRLVLVVDEFAALAERVPECHAILTDVAARGRSLGVHLILCTQRPAGVVREALLANAGLRICLRVASEDDSRAVVGSRDAAVLERPGRAILLTSTGQRRRLQIAEAEPQLPGRVADAWPPATIGRPWLPELPACIVPEDLPDGHGLVFGLADLPDQQAQPPAVWDPTRSRAMLVLGAPRSGRSTALAAVAAAAGAPEAIWPRPTLPCVWDAVSDALNRLDASAGDRRLLLLDDVDAVFAAAGGEYAHELADRVLRLLRAGSSSPLVVLAAARMPSHLGAATSLAGTRLLLRAASRDEHLLAGGASGTFDRTAPPGRGELDGIPVQVAFAVRGSGAPPELALPLQPLPGLLAVSSRPASLEAAFAAAEPERLAQIDGPPAAGRVLLGTPDEWQARWSLLRQLAATQPVLFDGCSPAEVRSLLGRHELPPPCSGRPRWLFRPGEAAVRVRASDPV